MREGGRGGGGGAWDCGMHDLIVTVEILKGGT